MTNDKITVLKFGGSVLRDENDLPLAVHDIYRRWRKGSQVLVVVSAFGNTTDALLERCKAYGSAPNQEAVASLLHTGETTTASLLALALDRAGLPCRLLTAQQAGLRTFGGPLDSQPVAIDTERIRQELQHSIVVVSGYAGVNDAGDIALLGRGGSDYSALFLSQRLGARCVLIKDVDGLYVADPNAEPNCSRFATASYETALRLGGALIQPKALRFAQRLCQEFEIVGIGADSGTVIGDHIDRKVDSPLSTTPIRVALLGCGTVGGGVYERLRSLPDRFTVVGVVNLDPQKALKSGIAEEHLHHDAYRLIEKDCDVVIELIGGVEPARSLIEHALGLGRHVITANKALLAEHATALEGLADSKAATIRYSGSVGGALPALEAVALAAETQPTAIAGIINGTTNFICDQLSSGAEYEGAVFKAQQEGFAEADPRLDLDGTDAAQKLVLLARTAFGVDLSLEDVEKTGIEELTRARVQEAAETGHSYRLIAECRRTETGVVASVKPVAIPSAHPFANTRGADNCLFVEKEDGESTIIRGRGAGRYPTTEAVIADLFDVRNSLLSSKLARVLEVAA